MSKMSASWRDFFGNEPAAFARIPKAILLTGWSGPIAGRQIAKDMTKTQRRNTTKTEHADNIICVLRRPANALKNICAR